MKVSDSKGVSSSGRLSGADKKAGVGATAYARAADAVSKPTAVSDMAAILYRNAERFYRFPALVAQPAG